jgi:hypothetical protein
MACEVRLGSRCEWVQRWEVEGRSLESWLAEQWIHRLTDESSYDGAVSLVLSLR